MTEAVRTGASAVARDGDRASPLDHRAIAADVASRGLPIGATLHYFRQVGSTSDVAADLVRAGAPHGTTVIADEQVAGRGRRGASRWQSPPCSAIALSVVVRPTGDANPAHLGRMGLCVAVASAEAIEAAASDVRAGVAIAVKWPNDLVVVGESGDAQKIGGILVEPAVVATVPPRVASVIVGIGVNVNLPSAAMAPVGDDALPPVSLVDVVGEAMPRERLVVAVLEAIGPAVDGWGRDEWPGWHARYAARLAWRGCEVEVHATDAVAWRGRVVGIDGDGSLEVRDGGGSVRTVVSGHVRRTTE